MKNKQKMTIAVLMATICLLVLVSYIALGGMNPSSNSSDRSNPENSPIAIRAEADKSSYTFGQSVNVRIYLTNHKNETLKIVGSVTTRFDVSRSTGEGVYGVTNCYTLHPDYPMELPPETEVPLPFEAFEWKQEAISIQDSGYNVTKVSTGTYVIRASVISQFGEVSAETTVSIIG